MQEWIYEGVALAGCAGTVFVCRKIRWAARKALKKEQPRRL